MVAQLGRIQSGDDLMGQLLDLNLPREASIDDILGCADMTVFTQDGTQVRRNHGDFS